jgi:putative transposase
MTAFIDAHRDVHGVEPICKVLPIAPSTYRAHAMIWRTPDLASKRAKQDAVLLPEVKRVWDNNLKVYRGVQGLAPAQAGGL